MVKVVIVNKIKSLYKKNNRKKTLLLYILIIILIILFISSLFIGQGGLSPIDVLKALFNIGDDTNKLIVYNMRFPRVLTALICGGGLAISGCVMQRVLNNPMASPTTLGVSNASVFGVNLALLLIGLFGSSTGFLNVNNPYLISMFSFIFSILATLLILALYKYKKFSKETIILSGVALGTIFEAATIIIQFFATDEFVSSAIFFTFGSLTRVNYEEIIIISVIVFISFLFFYLNKWNYKALGSGSSFAKTNGINVNRLTIISLLLSSVITAVIVSFVGIIGFLGLIAPQIIRRIIGDDFKYLLPSSFLLGSILLIIADDISRVLIFGMNLPVGAITSLVGGFIFIYLILEKRGNKNEIKN